MDARRTTVRDMRRANRSVLLTRIWLDGPLSRHELGQSTALSLASVSNLVGELIGEGIVEEAGSVESDGGRPRVLLRVAPGYGYLVGADVGETRVQVELFDLAMTALAKAEYPIAAAEPDPDQVASHLLHGLGAVVEQAGVDPTAVLGFGVAVSGTVERTADAVVHAQTIGWDGVPLGAMLRAGTDIPVHVDNGAKTLGQAEMWFGAGRGARHAVIALVGSGIGASVVADGVAYRGAHSSAGEWGHTTIVYGGRRCRCGNLGCLEAYVGAEGVLDRFRQANRGRPAVGADEESRLRRAAALLDPDGRHGARRDGRLPRRGGGDAGQPLQPGAGGARRLGRPGTGGAVPAADPRGDRAARAAPAVRADLDRAVPARPGRGRDGRGDPADGPAAARRRRRPTRRPGTPRAPAAAPGSARPLTPGPAARPGR